MSEATPDEFVWVQRQPGDWRIGKVALGSLEYPHWSDVSGGVRRRSRDMIYAYIWCDTIVEGEIAHSCLHGEGPHRVKVCITKTGNDKGVYAKLRASGPGGPPAVTPSSRLAISASASSGRARRARVLVGDRVSAVFAKKIVLP